MWLRDLTLDSWEWSILDRGRNWRTFEVIVLAMLLGSNTGPFSYSSLITHCGLMRLSMKLLKSFFFFLVCAEIVKC